MIHSLNFKQTDDHGNEWSLNDFSFGKINLIAGRNSTGKSRTLNVIAGLGGLVAGERTIAPTQERFEAHFTDGAQKIDYFLEYKESTVRKETLTIDADELLQRSDKGEGLIYAEELKGKIKFQVPEKSLACVVRRDSIQHPYFQSLYNWGSCVRRYEFGSQLGKNHIALFGKNEENSSLNPLNIKETNNVVAFFKRGIKDCGRDFIDLILNDINGIGYQIDEIGVGPVQTVKIEGIDSVTPEGIFIKEKGHSHRVEQNEISQGLFRAISLFIQLRFSEKFSEPSLILIDDIGEGIDYERSGALIHAIIGIAKISNVQLIMTTNDRFVMNNVPLEYWSVLERDGGRCSVLNYRNSKTIFDEFEMTGLSNFDFFSSQYYAGKIID